jgi:hypothetical protein
MISIKFRLEKAKRKGPEYPIVVRMGGKEYSINTQIECSEQSFLSTGRIKGKTTQVLQANADLQRMEAYLHDLYDTMKRENHGFPI